MHDDTCCSDVRSWFRAHAYSSVESFDEPPTWINRCWEWGPNKWPLLWCDLPDAETLDCGALAALAEEHFAAVGKPTYRAQVILEYPEGQSAHWRRAWERAGLESSWIADRLVYHEVVVIPALGAAGARMWDPSDGGWTRLTDAFGSPLAVRLDGPATPLEWEHSALVPDIWNVLSD